jgi:hypothetical protein
MVANVTEVRCAVSTVVANAASVQPDMIADVAKSAVGACSLMWQSVQSGLLADVAKRAVGPAW